jgi:hypothetical protein
MMQLGQLEQALHGVTVGAEAIRHAALALTGGPSVSIPRDFSYKASLAPIRQLARLFEVELSTPANTVLKPVRKPRARRARPAKSRAKPNKAQELEEFVEKVSAWDPEIYATDQQAEAASCRALLLEVIRRASYDWVLYRTSSKLQSKQLAESAFHWLFVEDEKSKQWQQRSRNGKGMMSFLTICETLDLEPRNVRRRVRELTSKDIMGAGRPAEHRKKPKNSDEAGNSDEHSVYAIDVEAIPTYDPMFATEG